jgi:hypothetical protein
MQSFCRKIILPVWLRQQGSDSSGLGAKQFFNRFAQDGFAHRFSLCRLPFAVCFLLFKWFCLSLFFFAVCRLHFAFCLFLFAVQSGLAIPSFVMR